MKPAFLPGDKLEAADVKNNNLVCVASVSDTYADKILVHFDGWEDTYDYWCTYSSAHIHPIGWCQDNLQILSAPNGYEDASKFTWESYLEDTKSRAAPISGFQPVSVQVEPYVSVLCQIAHASIQGFCGERTVC